MARQRPTSPPPRFAWGPFLSPRFAGGEDLMSDPFTSPRYSSNGGFSPSGSGTWKVLSVIDTSV